MLRVFEKHFQFQHVSKVFTYGLFCSLQLLWKAVYAVFWVVMSRSLVDGVPPNTTRRHTQMTTVDIFAAVITSDLS
jgi:hypothetical protein